MFEKIIFEVNIMPVSYNSLTTIQQNRSNRERKFFDLCDFDGIQKRFLQNAITDCSNKKYDKLKISKHMDLGRLSSDQVLDVLEHKYLVNGMPDVGIFEYLRAILNNRAEKDLLLLHRASQLLILLNLVKIHALLAYSEKTGRERRSYSDNLHEFQLFLTDINLDGFKTEKWENAVDVKGAPTICRALFDDFMLGKEREGARNAYQSFAKAFRCYRLTMMVHNGNTKYMQFKKQNETTKAMYHFHADLTTQMRTKVAEAKKVGSTKITETTELPVPVKVKSTSNTPEVKKLKREMAEIKARLDRLETTTPADVTIAQTYPIMADVVSMPINLPVERANIKKSAQKSSVVAISIEQPQPSAPPKEMSYGSWGSLDLPPDSESRIIPSGPSAPLAPTVSQSKKITFFANTGTSKPLSEFPRLSSENLNRMMFATTGINTPPGKSVTGVVGNERKGPSNPLANNHRLFQSAENKIGVKTPDTLSSASFDSDSERAIPVGRVSAFA